MYLPDPYIEKLIFEHQIDLNELKAVSNWVEHLNIEGDFANINWLNTPGPIYTTTTDNCGTGQIEAINNVGGDENYHEIIFKQPSNTQELMETIVAAFCDPFGSYYFDGNLNWDVDSILNWWNKSEGRVNYIVARYKDELELPDDPHISSWKIGEKIFTGRLFGPPRPIPENYKSWLDFYQLELIGYLKWYINKIHHIQIELPELKYDWRYKQELDRLYQLKFESK